MTNFFEKVASFNVMNRYAAFMVVVMAMLFASCETEHGDIRPGDVPNAVYAHNVDKDHTKDSTGYNNYVVTGTAYSNWWSTNYPKEEELKGNHSTTTVSTANISLNVEELTVDFMPTAPEIDPAGEKYNKTTTFTFPEGLVATVKHTGQEAELQIAPYTETVKDTLIVDDYPTAEFRGIKVLQELGEQTINGKIYINLECEFRAYARHSCESKLDADLRDTLVITLYKENYKPGEDPVIIDWKLERYVINCGGNSIDFYFTDFYSDGTKKEGVKETYSLGEWSASIVGIGKQYFDNKNLGIVAITGNTSAPKGSAKTEGNLIGQQMTKSFTGTPSNSAFTQNFTINTEYPVVSRKVGTLQAREVLNKETVVTFNEFAMSNTSTGTEGDYKIYPTTASFHWAFLTCGGDINTLFDAYVKEIEKTWEWAYDVTKQGIDWVNRTTDNTWADMYKKWSDGSETDRRKYACDIYSNVNVASRQYIDRDAVNASYSANGSKTAAQATGNPRNANDDFVVSKFAGKWNISLEGVTFGNVYDYEIAKRHGFTFLYNQPEFGNVRVANPVQIEDAANGKAQWLVVISWDVTRTGQTWTESNELVIRVPKAAPQPSFSALSASSEVRLVNGAFVTITVVAVESGNNDGKGKAIVFQGDQQIGGAREIVFNGQLLSANNFNGTMTISYMNMPNNTHYGWRSVETATLGAETGISPVYRYHNEGYYQTLVDLLNPMTFTQNGDGSYTAHCENLKGVGYTIQVPNPATW